jgi:hypothetical protein
LLACFLIALSGANRGALLSYTSAPFFIFALNGTELLQGSAFWRNSHPRHNAKLSDESVALET